MNKLNSKLMITHIVYMQQYPASSCNTVKINILPVASAFLEDPCCRLLVEVAHTGETSPLQHEPSQKLALHQEYHKEFYLTYTMSATYYPLHLLPRLHSKSEMNLKINKVHILVYFLKYKKFMFPTRLLGLLYKMRLSNIKIYHIYFKLFVTGGLSHKLLQNSD